MRKPLLTNTNTVQGGFDLKKTQQQQQQLRNVADR